MAKTKTNKVAVEAENVVPVAAPEAAPVSRESDWPALEASLNYTDPATGNLLVKAMQPQTEKAWNMARILASQPKVNTVLVLDDGEKPGRAVAVKTINGFQLRIVKGVYVVVPAQIHEEAQRSYNETLKASSDRKVRIHDPITGTDRFINPNLSLQTEADRLMAGG